MENLTNKFDNVKHEEVEILNKILQNEGYSKDTVEERKNELRNYREITRKLENTCISELKEELNKMRTYKIENLSNYGRTYYFCLERELEERNKLLEGTTIPYILDKYEMLIRNRLEVKNIMNAVDMIKEVSSIGEFRYKVRQWNKKIKKLEKYLREEHDFKTMKFFGKTEYQIYNDIRNVMISLAIIVELKTCKKKLNNNNLNYSTFLILAKVMELLNQLKYYSKIIYSKDTCVIEDYLDDIITNYNLIIGVKRNGGLVNYVLSLVSDVYYA